MVLWNTVWMIAQRKGVRGTTHVKLKMHRITVIIAIDAQGHKHA